MLKSKTAFNTICNEGGQQERSVQSTIPVTKKKGQNFALEFNQKYKFKIILNVFMPCSSALPLLAFTS